MLSNMSIDFAKGFEDGEIGAGANVSALEAKSIEGVFVSRRKDGPLKAGLRTKRKSAGLKGVHRIKDAHLRKLGHLCFSDWKNERCSKMSNLFIDF